MLIKCCRVAIRTVLEDDNIRTLAHEPYMLSTGHIHASSQASKRSSGLKNGVSVVKQTG
ncbi:hypothetical protein [Endozoicomonas euniceicola]|uniref:Uncharacterized protein n=1 Tax=Endozoicomonas euniceicola TaxID=1234143 RepID=A0ABY6GUP1_9GAMM|nr:hypothetical protein [Endozoicomonas euniceicola]UYM16491.1 hypothetical protein NX720_00720 [Endozoicomonas euniceicola]